MSKARLVITALFVEHRTPAEVAARYEAEGEAALEPRSRRRKTSPSALSPEVVDLIVRTRKELTDAGLDAGPETIGCTSSTTTGTGSRDRPSAAT